jgi:SHS family lactate transporter-like MFS transporter
MVIIDDLRALNGPQRAAFTASLLGWALDAFDYFLLVFVLKDIAREFHADIAAVNSALFLTLIARPVGALVFGRLSDRYGRRPMLMTVVGLYSVLAVASAFSPTLLILLVLPCSASRWAEV